MPDNLAKDLYLELLKKTILSEIWIEHEPGATPEKRLIGADWPTFGHTMIGRLRMENLHQCMTSVLEENIEGDFIETGVWRGGACIFMRGFLKANGIKNRRIWVADSFQGLPEWDVDQFPVDKNYLPLYEPLKVTLEKVKENFQKYDLLDEQVCFLKGWFKDTLPNAPIEKIAVARLDGDYYSSTMDSLRNLYPKISKGGYIIIDDYTSIESCRAAVTDFRKEFNIDERIINIDWTGVYWRKQQS